MTITKDEAKRIATDLRPAGSWQIANGRTYLYFHEHEEVLRELKPIVRLHHSLLYLYCYQHALRKGKLHGHRKGFFLQVDCTNQ